MTSYTVVQNENIFANSIVIVSASKTDFMKLYLKLFKECIDTYTGIKQYCVLFIIFWAPIFTDFVAASIFHKKKNSIRE